MISQEIIDRCKRKERLAYKQCYELCAPYVYTIIKNYLYDEEVRKDAMQESFANIFKAIDSFDETKGLFKSWIAKITVNQCIGILRKSKKLNLFVPLEDAHVNTKVELGHLDKFNREELEFLLSKMPEGYKTVFLLSVVDNYSHKEIGKMINVSPETSRSQLFRAIKWIKKNHIVQLKNYIYG